MSLPLAGLGESLQPSPPRAGAVDTLGERPRLRTEGVVEPGVGVVAPTLAAEPRIKVAGQRRCAQVDQGLRERAAGNLPSDTHLDEVAWAGRVPAGVDRPIRSRSDRGVEVVRKTGVVEEERLLLHGVDPQAEDIDVVVLRRREEAPDARVEGDRVRRPQVVEVLPGLAREPGIA